MGYDKYTPPSNGITGGYTGDNSSILRAMVAFSAIAWYNSVELIFLICFRFKKWRGLYFWSLMVTSWAIVIYQIGSYGRMTNAIPDKPVIMATLTNIGWIVMVTGESLVLYSRLHLLSQHRLLLRFVLWGILINSFVCYVPTTVLDYSSNIVHPGNPVYTNGYSIMERIQMTLLTIQEIAISAIYLVEAYKFLNISFTTDKRSRNIMYELSAINVIIIVLDIALLTVAQLDYFQIEVTLKGLVYSIKLKLELGVLSRLVHIVSGSNSGLHHTPTFDNDLANVSNSDKALGGLDFFNPSPFSDEKSRSNPGSDSTLVSSPPPPSMRGRRARSSVPWLATSMRARPVESQSPLRPPAIFRNSHHNIQRGGSYVDTEFLTSAAVTESANDENIRQFQREIEAELHSPTITQSVAATMHRSLPSSDGPSGLSIARVSSRHQGEEAVSPGTKLDPTIDDNEDELEEEWAKGLGVLGAHQTVRRPDLSRESSLRNLYPGRLTGDNG
ncbi:hypothetical protein ANO11243_062940 [Dothideomycetidae sp. 11243]|nr:hypothetical protein ANO11243_062940 [fungal sp. No.11243]